MMVKDLNIKKNSSGALELSFAGLSNAAIKYAMNREDPEVILTKEKNFIEEENSLATAIVDKVAHRKEKVMQTIKNSRGSGWVINNEEIKSAIKLVKEKTDIEISENSALAIAGLAKAVRNSWKFTGAVVCLITGK